jgi:hypothetical protein
MILRRNLPPRAAHRTRALALARALMLTRVRSPAISLAALCALATLAAPALAASTASGAVAPGPGGTAAPSAAATTPASAVPATAASTSAASTGAATTTTPPTTTYAPQASTTIAPATTPTGSAAAASAAAAARARSGSRAHRSSGLSTPAIALAVLGGLLALGCLTWALARMLAYEPRWLQSLRHALAEGGFRASATWAEFADWARLGR